MRRRHQYRMLQVAFVFALVGIAFFGAYAGMTVEQTGHQPPQPASDGKSYAGAFWHWVTHEAAGFFTLALCFVTGWLAYVTRGLYVATARLADDSKEASAAALTASTEGIALSRAALIATNRAWIHTPEIRVGAQPLIFYSPDRAPLGASASASFRIKNVGNAPATKVTLHARMIVMKNGGPSPTEAQEALSREIRERSFGMGFTLFPNETYPDNEGVAGVAHSVHVTREDIDKALESSPSAKAIALYVIGCIDYTFPADPETHHQTGFIREFRRTRLPLLIQPNGGDIPYQDLALDFWHINAGRPAD